MTRKLLFSFDADFANVDLARAAIQGVCRELFQDPICLDALNDFFLATTEALNNAVEHGQTPQVEGEIFSIDNRIALQISVAGEEFDSTRPVEFPDADADEWLPEGGYGLALIQELSDQLEHTYRDGKNILTIWKNIPHP